MLGIIHDAAESLWKAKLLVQSLCFILLGSGYQSGNVTVRDGMEEYFKYYKNILLIAHVVAGCWVTSLGFD